MKIVTPDISATLNEWSIEDGVVTITARNGQFTSLPVAAVAYWQYEPSKGVTHIGLTSGLILNVVTLTADDQPMVEELLAELARAWQSRWRQA